MCLLGAAAFAPSRAFANCTPATGDNVTVTCSGATVDQGPEPNTGYGSGLQNGLTINVQAGASVTGTSIGIDVGSNNVINNFGTVTTAGSGGVGDIAGINANGTNLTVNNSGTIGRLDIPGFAFSAAGISAFTGLSVTNNTGATIQGQIGIQGNGTADITNSGLIQGAEGGDGINVAGGSVTVKNLAGTITGNATGITADVVTVTHNFGTISAPATNGFFGGTAINASTSLDVTNDASGIITSDGSAITAPTITVTNFGTISSGASGIGGGTVNVTNSGSILGGSGFAAISMTTGAITNNAGGTISGDLGITAFGNTTIFNAGTITGAAGTAILFFSGGNTLTLAPGSVINGTAHGFGADTFQLGGTGADTFDAGLFATQFSGYTTFNKIGTSTWTLTGTNAAAMPWTISAGRLDVNGLIANSTMTVVTGGTLGGSGTVGSTIVNGGTLAPGSAGGSAFGPLTVQGSLMFASAATYMVEVSSSSADRTNVTGAATLAGTVQATFLSGGFARTYIILSATGGRSGTFGTLTTAGLPPGFTATLSYTATDAILNLTSTLAGGTGSGLSQNQQNVANAINNFFNNGGTLPPGFLSLFNLTGGNLANALTLLSGEAATGAQQGAFQLGGQFLGLMLDPFVDGRAGFGGAGGGAVGFAPERAAMPDDIALAYAKVLKAPVYKAPTFEQRWTVWGGAYGGYNRTSGDPLVVGSHDLSARAGGFAAGMDYRLTRDTVVGFALAGGGTNWSLAQGLGGGRSDAFQAGVYGATRNGPLYLAASLALTQHWMTTDRFAFAGDHLTASFNAQSFGARAEGGYRVPTGFGAFTPYAALQAQNFRTPGYREIDVNGGGFGLAYDARNATDTRSELGARYDKQIMLDRAAVLALRGRLAWAHDWVSDPALFATFQALPGASFIVNGATPAKDAALTSAGAELRLANGVTLIGKFDGEFASHSQTYAGTGTVRVAW